MALIVETSGKVRDAHRRCLAAALETLIITPPPTAAAPTFFPFKY